MADTAQQRHPTGIRRLGHMVGGQVRASTGYPVQPSRSWPYPEGIQSGRFESTTLPNVAQSNPELYRTRASRLVDFFPDELVIQEKTVSIIRRSFLVSFVETLPVKDIGRVVLIDTPLFDGLRVLGKNPAHDLQIKGLHKSSAHQAKEMIESLLVEGIDATDAAQWATTEESVTPAGAEQHAHDDERR